MVKKKGRQPKQKNKVISKETPQKNVNKENIDVFNNSCVTKFEVLPPDRKNFYERKFIISSISGNQYTVTVNKLVNCTCPICTFKAKRCKHIEFVMQDILHEKYPRIYYDDKALDKLFRYLPGHESNRDEEESEE